MDKRTKKDLTYLLIGLFITFLLCFFIFDIVVETSLMSYDVDNYTLKEKIEIYLDMETLIDDGYANEGAIIFDKNKRPYKLNKNSCIEHGGKWNEDIRICDFR